MEDLPVPDSYRQAPVETTGSTAFNVAELYGMIASDLRGDTSLAPDFDVALKRHELLDAIERSSANGQRQTL